MISFSDISQQRTLKTSGSTKINALQHSSQSVMYKKTLEVTSFVLDTFGFKSSYCVRLLQNDADIKFFSKLWFQIKKFRNL